MTQRTLSSSVRLALSIAALPLALGAATPAAAIDSSPVDATATAQGFGLTAAAAFGASPMYPDHGRYLLVDAASARLFMVEDGVVRDSMRVIVGKPATQTPTLASKIYYATLNPYWNVPANLAQSLIAPRVLAQGVGYLKAHNYQVLASFDADAPEISPTTVDWKAVADGRATVKVRQLPGPANSMGQVKFGFPNNDGVFLHDTPEKDLFATDQRALSNGCVRLEDAPRLARWMLGRDPASYPAAPEENVLLPQAVPIYITYLNAPATGELALAASGSSIAP